MAVEPARLTISRTDASVPSPGHHRLRAYNPLVWKTVEFGASAGEHVHFSTANRAGFGAWLVAVLGAGPMYVTLERQANPAGSA